jgi:hypothetical protein
MRDRGAANAARKIEKENGRGGETENGKMYILTQWKRVSEEGKLRE